MKHDIQVEPRTYRVREVAEILRRSEKNIRRCLADGLIPGIRIGGAWAIPCDQFDAFLRGEWTPAEHQPTNNV